MTFRELIEVKEKVGCIISARRGKTTRWIGTVSSLTDSFRYTLETGKSYENEKGNKKINLNPKTIKALVNELQKSLKNSGNSGYYEYDDCSVEEVDRYKKEGNFEISVRY